MIDRLAQDLRSAFPDMNGFSRANLMYMRAFAEGAFAKRGEYFRVLRRSQGRAFSASPG